MAFCLSGSDNATFTFGKATNGEECGTKLVQEFFDVDEKSLKLGLERK